MTVASLRCLEHERTTSHCSPTCLKHSYHGQPGAPYKDAVKCDRVEAEKAQRDFPGQLDFRRQEMSTKEADSGLVGDSSRTGQAKSMPY